MTRLRNCFAATFILMMGWFGTGRFFAADIPAKIQTSSNEYVIDVWQAEDGLPQNSVKAMAQAGDGYLWLLTDDAVTRFDGVRFQVFDAANSPAMAEAQVTGLFADQQGTIWLKTARGGLLRWDDGHFERCLQERSGAAVINVFGRHDGSAIIFLADGKVVSWKPGQITQLAAAEQFGSPRAMVLRQDEEEGIWFIGSKGKLIRLKDDTFEEIAPQGLRGNRISQLVIDSVGRLWVGTDKKLARWQAGRFEAIPSPANEPDLDVRGLLAGAGGHVWMTANNKMWVWYQGQLKLVRSPWPPFAEEWTGDLADRKGDIWHSTIGRGLVRTSTDGQVSYFTAEGKLPVNRALTLCQDREGNIWAGLEGGGLVRLRERRFDLIGTAEGIWARVLLSVCVDNEGAMWCGTRGGGLFWRKDGEVKHFDLSRARTNGIVFSVFSDRTGTVWAGTQDNGLFCFDHGQFIRPFDSELAQSQVRAIYEDHTGRLWFGHSAGIFCWDKGHLKAYGTNDDLLRPDVRAIVEDSRGRLWLGTASGVVARLEGEHFVVQKANGLGNDSVTALHSDADGALWVGTMHGGLSRLQDGKFRNYTSKDSLPDDHICAILEDDLGNLWLGTYGGLLRVSKSSLAMLDTEGTNKLDCLVFNKADGLATRECSSGSQPAAWRTADGRLLFATVNGVVSFNADKLKLNLLPPPVVVEAMLVNGQRTTGTRIAPGERQLEFHFTAPSLSAPTKVQFRYKLETLDAHWIEAGTRRSASYSYVPPGSYRFRVIARNNDGVWNMTGATIAFTVPPYIWETHWFQALALLALLGGVAGAVRYVTRQRFQHKLALVERQSALDRERARIAQDLHDDLGSSLTQINFLGALAENNDADPAQAKQDIARIRNKAREMVLALDEIVWTVNPKNDSVSELTAYLCHTAQDFFRGSTIRCRLDVPPSLPKQALTTEVRHNVLLAVKEALNNIAKHAEASEVWLRIEVPERTFTIRIEDNGLGLPEQPNDDSGDGLNNIRRRLKSIGGQATVQSQSSHGTTVELRLPLNQAES